MVTNGSAAAAFMPGNPGDELADFARTTIAAHFGLAISCGIHYDPYRALDKARSARDEIWPLELDFNWAAENRERILAEWTKRYNVKSEKR